MQVVDHHCEISNDVLQSVRQSQVVGSVTELPFGFHEVVTLVHDDDR